MSWGGKGMMAKGGRIAPPIRPGAGIMGAWGAPAWGAPAWGAPAWAAPAWAAPAKGGPPTAPAKDFKTQLNTFCQKTTKRPVTKDDLVYTTTKNGTMFQTVLRLVCLEGKEFAGELCAQQKQAEQSAARQALLAHGFNEQQLAMAEVKAAPALKAHGERAEAPNLKSQLNSFCMKTAGRPLTKTDIVYNVSSFGDQFQATVALHCNGGQEFAGQLSQGSKEAEQSAAQQALLFLGQTPTGVAPAAQGKAKPKKGDSNKRKAIDLACASSNAKTELNAFCQQSLSRSLSKEDIVYAVAKVGQQYQATVTLACMGGEEYAGEVAENQKLAEHAAAFQALQQHAPNIALLNASAAPRAVQAKPRRRPIDASGGGAGPKSELHSFCEQYCDEVLTKDNVAYSAAKVGDSFQATVKLVCLEGKEFAGEVCPTRPEAERAAALEALQNFTTEIELLNASAPPAPEPKSSGQAAKPQKRKAIDLHCETSNPKTELNNFCQQACSRPVTKEDILYTVVQSDGQFQATVKLACLDGEEHTGEATSTAKAAELAAAFQALSSNAEKITELNASAAPITAPKPKQPKLSAWAAGPQSGESKWPSGPELPREFLAEAQDVTGEIVLWRGTHGFIKTEKGAINHPEAKKRQGKVYVHKQDLVDDAAELKVGMSVQFKVYVDPSGLGAAEVTVC